MSTLLKRIKHFLGLGFYLLDYEKIIIDAVCNALGQEEQTILKDQFSRFNRVSRQMKADPDLNFGDVSFYWIKKGKPFMDFPLRFNHVKEEEKLATLELLSNSNKIYVEIMMVRGVIFSIQFKNKEKRYIPEGGFEINNIQIRRAHPVG